jgi:hypothetical protein
VTFSRVYQARIVAIEHKTRTGKAVRVGDDDWRIYREDLGWFVTLEGFVSLFVGSERPDDIEVGQTVEVVLRSTPR